MGLNNSETLLYPSYDHAFFSITQDASGVAPTLTAQSGGPSARAAITMVRNSAGNYTVTCTDFLRARTLSNVQATISSTVAGMIAVPVGTWSGSTLTFSILTFNSSGVATDFTCNVDVASY